MTDPSAPRATGLPLVAILIVALAAGLGLWAGQRWFAPTATTAPAMANTVLYPQPRLLPDFALDGSNGVVDAAALRGHWSLVFLGFTHCPDICPTTLFEVSEVFNRLGADAEKVSAIFVTVDPERDTPEKLKLYLSSFHPRISALSGSDAQVEAIKKAYFVYAKRVPLEGGSYTMDHTSVVYLMDRQGKFVAPFNLKRDADAAAADLRRRL